VVNFDTVKVTAVAPLKVPVRSFTVSTRADIATLHVAEEGAVTVQTLVESIAVPEPTNVIITPPPAVMAVVGVKEIVAVVAAFFAAEVRVIVGPAVMPPMIAANVPMAEVSAMIGVPAPTVAIDHPIAIEVEAACMAGVVNFVKVKVMSAFAA